MMSQMKISRTVDQIEGDIDLAEKQMFIHQKNGNYVDAEHCRVRVEQLKRDLEIRTLYEMDHRHKRETNQLHKAHEDELQSFNNLWDHSISQIWKEGENSQKNLQAKHQAEIQQTRKDLQIHLSLKVKESSECLNLKKMEEYMVKQKNFAEAHKVQQSIFEMEKKEREQWIENRNIKIETALTTLRGKQNSQSINLKKKIKTLVDEQNIDRKRQEERLRIKYQNNLKDLKSQQQKQNLCFKGEFRSKGGRDSPLKTRSIILTH